MAKTLKITCAPIASDMLYFFIEEKSHSCATQCVFAFRLFELVAFESLLLYSQASLFTQHAMPHASSRVKLQLVDPSTASYLNLALALVVALKKKTWLRFQYLEKHVLIPATNNWKTSFLLHRAEKPTSNSDFAITRVRLRLSLSFLLSPLPPLPYPLPLLAMPRLLGKWTLYHCNQSGAVIIRDVNASLRWC